MKDEIYEKAYNIIRQRRISAINENERRISEINNKIPEIREVNNQILNSSKELINLILNEKKQDIAKITEELKQYNLEAQKWSRQLLADFGYPEDYLDIHFSCKSCNDTGYLNAEHCKCFKKLYGKLMSDELNKQANLKLSSFDNFRLDYYQGEDYSIMHRIFDYTREYAENFSLNSKNIFMFGVTGVGKTHLSFAIANEVLKKGFSVVYDSIVNIVQKIAKENFSRNYSNDITNLIMNAELLIIDDLGTEYRTEFNNSTVYNIINTRLNKGFPTIISTNLNFNDIRERYEPRVISRIASMYTCLEFKGNDVRMQICRENSKDKKQLEIVNSIMSENNPDNKNTINQTVYNNSETDSSQNLQNQPVQKKNDKGNVYNAYKSNLDDIVSERFGR